MSDEKYYCERCGSHIEDTMTAFQDGEFVYCSEGCMEDDIAEQPED